MNYLNIAKEQTYDLPKGVYYTNKSYPQFVCKTGLDTVFANFGSESEAQQVARALNERFGFVEVEL